VARLTPRILRELAKSRTMAVGIKIVQVGLKPKPKAWWDRWDWDSNLHLNYFCLHLPPRLVVLFIVYPSILKNPGSELFVFLWINLRD